MKVLSVLIAGVGPIPPHKPRKLYAPGLRVWGFADTIEKHGYKVILCEGLFGGEEHDIQPSETLFKNRHIRHHILPIDPQSAAKKIKELVQVHKPECVISTTDVMNNAVILAGPPVPCWLDFFGHPMAERQMQAKVFDSDEGLIDQWFMILPALLGGDHFSVCSRAQKSALLGELGASGRLNKLTANTDLVDIILPALVLSGQEGKKGAIKENLTADDAVIILHTGGYNTWMDEKTLFRALRYAIKRNPKIHFVSTGGEIKGHNEKTFHEFKKKVDGSKIKSHFHFRGWVPAGNVPDYYLEADLAVNIDLFSCEGLFGTRNRVLEWVDAGLPVVTTPLSELCEDLAARNLVATFDYEDWESLGNYILAVAEDPATYRLKATRAQEYVRGRYTMEKTLEPMLRWLENPLPAPDLPIPKSRHRLEPPICPYNALARFRAEAFRNQEILVQIETGRKPFEPESSSGKVASFLKKFLKRGE